jgi:lipid-A-disaccharide synthase
MTVRPLTVHLVAAEESGDVLGGALMGALRARHADIAFGGVGGRTMESQGLKSPFDTADLSIIGIASIPRRLPLILRRIRETADAVVAAKPDALIIIDSPDFTHRVARAVRKAAPRIPIVNYAPPSVWAWRPWRARAMRRYIDEVLAILPFEPAAFARLGGPHCTYVGHPLAERIGELRPDAGDTRRNSDPPVVLVLPGSRASEIRRLADVFGAAIAEAAERAGPFDLVLPTLPHIAGEVAAATRDWRVRPRIVVEPEEKHAAFRAARVALAASGTVTLELALARVPMVAAYRIRAWEGLVFRMMVTDIKSVILANIVLGENVVPEFLQGDCTPDRLAGALVPLLGDTPERGRQLDAFVRLDTVMDLSGEAPSARAARAVLALIEGKSALPSPGGSC